MVWRLCVAVFLIAAIIAGGIFANHYTEKVCIEFIAELNKSEVNAAHFIPVYEKWNEKSDALSLIIEQDKIIEITSNFDRAKGFMDCENWDEFAGGIAELIGSFEFLREYDSPKLSNIF